MIDNMASDLNKWWQNISLHSWHLRREFMAITLMDRYIHKLTAHAVQRKKEETERMVCILARVCQLQRKL